MGVKSYNSKQLTQHLREMAAEAETLLDDGSLVTRGQALAIILWKKALGYEEADPDNPGKTVRHRPESWAIQMIFDRMEGKVPLSMPDEKGSLSASEKVSDLARSILNAEARASLAVSESAANMELPDHGSGSPERPESEPGVAD